MRYVRKSIIAGIALGVVVLMGGCGSYDQGPGETDTLVAGENQIGNTQDLTAPDAQGSNAGGFYPLDIGNQWTYTGEFAYSVDGGPPSVGLTREEYSIIGTEERFGRQYVLEKQTSFDENGEPFNPFWFRHRQDRAGFYTADIAANEPPLDAPGKASCLRQGMDPRARRMAEVWSEMSPGIQAEHRDAYRKGWEDLCRRLQVIRASTRSSGSPAAILQGPPGGVLPGEITMLRYPLHPGQEWTIRDDPFYVFGAVESHDVLDLPPGKMNGYKIRITNDYFGPDDMVYYWYGRAGFLGLMAHVEVEIVDPAGNPIGTMAIDEHLFLESLDLAGNGRW